MDENEGCHPKGGRKKDYVESAWVTTVPYLTAFHSIL
jgi:hypothetical protein